MHLRYITENKNHAQHVRRAQSSALPISPWIHKNKGKKDISTRIFELRTHLGFANIFNLKALDTGSAIEFSCLVLSGVNNVPYAFQRH